MTHMVTLHLFSKIDISLHNFKERERLLTQVKEDNKEIATMERQVAETQDQSSRLQEELSQVDR